MFDNIISSLLPNYWYQNKEAVFWLPINEYIFGMSVLLICLAGVELIYAKKFRNSLNVCLSLVMCFLYYNIIISRKNR